MKLQILNLAFLNCWSGLILLGLLSACPAWAETQQVNAVLDAQATPSFPILMQQAEWRTISIVNQTFASQPQVTTLSVQILGQRGSSIVPLLFTTVSRVDWQQRPNIQLWAKNFGVAAILLGFQKLPVSHSLAYAPPEMQVLNWLAFPRGQSSPISDVEPNFYD